jgi:hypothetical protein
VSLAASLTDFDNHTIDNTDDLEGRITAEVVQAPALSMPKA